MIQSRLTAHGMLARFAFFITNSGILVLPIMLIRDKASILEWCYSILGIIFFVLISLILVLFTRKISIDLDKITYTNWVTGKARIYYFKDLDGYITITRPIGIAYKEHESVILMKENKRIGEISHIYYSNYDELKDGLKDLKYLGRKDNNNVYSIKDNFIELFKQ